MSKGATRGRPPYPDQLTPGEWRVVEGVRHGLSNRVIAKGLDIRVDGVKYHVANALAKLGLSNRLELRRWTGVSRTSARHDGKESDMSGTGKWGQIGQVARTVRDIAAAKQWYSDTLQLEHLYSFGNLAFFDCDGTRLFLSEGEGETAQSILYFRVEDIAAKQAELEGRGIVFTHAPHMIHRHEDGTEEWMAFFTDNEDRLLGIMAQVAPSG